MKVLVIATLAALALPAGLAAQAPTAQAGDSLHLRVDGMVCSLCAYGAERRLNKIQNVERVKVELDHGLVVVVLEPGTTVSDSVLSKEIERAGFALREVRRYPRAALPAKPKDEW